MELYRKWRPKTLDDVVGQDCAIKVLKDKLNTGFPHAVLLSGGSGVGKTTISRIIRRQLGATPDDYQEINAADERGIDKVREVKQRMLYAAYGTCRVYFWDECHRLTPDGQASMLKMLEDTPDHVYFLLATTDPEKLLDQIRNRCMEIRLASLGAKDQEKVLKTVLAKEERTVEQDVLDKIVELAEGSARKALVLLDQIINLKTVGEQLESLQKADTQRQAKELARMLMAKKPWKEIAAVLEGVEESEETLRRMILGYARSVLLGGGRGMERAAVLINVFESNCYDGGKAAFALRCWEMVK